MVGERRGVVSRQHGSLGRDRSRRRNLAHGAAHWVRRLGRSVSAMVNGMSVDGETAARFGRHRRRSRMSGWGCRQRLHVCSLHAGGRPLDALAGRRGRRGHVRGERFLPLDLWHRLVRVAVDLAVVHLQTLLRGEGRFAHGVLTVERFDPQVDEHVLFQVGLLREVFVTTRANVFLLPVVDFLDVAIQRVLRAEDHLALGAVQLLRPLVHLLDMLLERLGVQVDLPAFVARLFQRFLRGVNPTLVLHETVIRLEPFQTVTAEEG